MICFILTQCICTIIFYAFNKTSATGETLNQSFPNFLNCRFYRSRWGPQGTISRTNFGNHYSTTLNERIKTERKIKTLLLTMTNNNDMILTVRNVYTVIYYVMQHWILYSDLYFMDFMVHYNNDVFTTYGSQTVWRRCNVHFM